VTLADLPRNWAAPEPASKLRDIGQHWLERGASVILKVPSAVVVEEWNYLLDPLHADFKKLALGKPKRYQFDR
jgi:RES domain-containing protein